MNAFPLVDPIPLPAPVWLFKGLHVLTLALHFGALSMLLGGLLVATVLSLLARGRGEGSRLRLNAAAVLARRLPVVMTYVINLGVPPLLFAQVLYGRAIYTSSVLIGLYWLSVIGLLMGCYWLLYRFATALESGQARWWLGLGSLVLGGLIARIYSTNMTLMLRPEVWAPMYAASAGGAHLAPVDVTLLPRWLFMLAGGLTVGGLWMLWLAGRNTIEPAVRAYLAKVGGLLVITGTLLQVGIGWWVFQVQPEGVKSGLIAGLAYRIAVTAWLATALLALVVGAWAALRRPQTKSLGWVSFGLALGWTLSLAVYRDGIRDLTLASKGFDVWDRAPKANWGVVGLFLVLFVAGLGVAGWLISVVMRARPINEKVA